MYSYNLDLSAAGDVENWEFDVGEILFERYGTIMILLQGKKTGGCWAMLDLNVSLI